jgi:hypothetical protein
VLGKAGKAPRHSIYLSLSSADLLREQ